MQRGENVRGGGSEICTVCTNGVVKHLDKGILHLQMAKKLAYGEPS